MVSVSVRSGAKPQRSSECAPPSCALFTKNKTYGEPKTHTAAPHNRSTAQSSRSTLNSSVEEEQIPERLLFLAPHPTFFPRGASHKHNSCKCAAPHNTVPVVSSGMYLFCIPALSLGRSPLPFADRRGQRGAFRERSLLPLAAEGT